MQNLFHKKSIVTQNKSELSDLVQVPAKIVEMNNIQQPGFIYNQKHVDMLVRLGFAPTDAVYELVMEFFDGGTRKNYWIRLHPDLSNLDKCYQDVKSPEDFVGKNILCGVAKGEFYSGPIHKVFPQN